MSLELFGTINNWEATMKFAAAGAPIPYEHYV